MSESVLEARGLSVGYGKQAVVRKLDLTLAAGEILVLLGPNGAGKSTSLMGLSGELPPLAGDVLFDGATCREPVHRRARRGLAFVTEERSVFTGMSTRDNIRAGRVQADDVLRLFPELEPRMRVRAGLLSGGEQQMLTLGRALARRPRVLLADELSLGLAPLVVDRLFSALRTAAEHDGTGVVLVEQHIRRALDIADHAVVMIRGEVRFAGTAHEIAAQLNDIESAYFAKDGADHSDDGRRAGGRATHAHRSNERMPS